MISFPPRSAKGRISGSFALITVFTGVSASARSLSKFIGRLAGSQEGSLNAKYLKKSDEIDTGAGPADCAHNSSLPGNSGPKISFLVRGFVAGEYNLRAAATCAGVRHDGPSAVLHSRTLGSNLQRVGSSSTPSSTPSRRSQAASTAL